MMGDMLNEIEVLRTLRHPHIVGLRAAYATPSHVLLVTELAAGGQLLRRIAQLPEGRAEEEMRRHARAILRALAYMHDVGIKPENVLLSDTTDAAQR